MEAPVTDRPESVTAMEPADVRRPSAPSAAAGYCWSDASARMPLRPRSTRALASWAPLPPRSTSDASDTLKSSDTTRALAENWSVTV